MLYESVQASLGKSQINAADELGITTRQLRRRLAMARDRGISTLAMRPPEGFITKGVSTLYDADGEVKAQWVKDTLSSEHQQAAMEEAVQAMVEPLMGIAKPIKPPKTEGGDYMVGFPLGDAHLGLLSWGEETGLDWDSAIAEKAICSAMDSVIDAAPATDECWLWQLGDFFHIDSDAGTTANGTAQDMDTRFRKVIRVGVRTERYLLEKALTKYKTVNLRNVEGNHDRNSFLVLDEAMKAFYHDEPRLIVHDSPKPIFIHRWHSNLFAITHGHKPKPAMIPSNMATDSPDWSSCSNKYAHHGHFHQKERKVSLELGVEVECHAAPTAPCAWTVGMGYRSNREVKAIVYHKDEGEVQRFISQVKVV